MHVHVEIPGTLCMRLWKHVDHRSNPDVEFEMFASSPSLTFLNLPRVSSMSCSLCSRIQKFNDSSLPFLLSSHLKEKTFFTQLTEVSQQPCR